MLECKHNLKDLRERVRNAIYGSSSYALISLRYSEENLETITNGLVTALTHEVVNIMGEHGDEIIEEMKRIMDTGKVNK